MLDSSVDDFETYKDVVNLVKSRDEGDVNDLVKIGSTDPNDIPY